MIAAPELRRLLGTGREYLWLLGSWWRHRRWSPLHTGQRSTRAHGSVTVIPLGQVVPHAGGLELRHATGKQATQTHGAAAIVDTVVSTRSLSTGRRAVAAGCTLASYLAWRGENNTRGLSILAAGQQELMRVNSLTADDRCALVDGDRLPEGLAAPDGL